MTKMTEKPLCLIVVGGLIRYLLMLSKYSSIFHNRVEINTPLNSFKRANEGIFLLKHGIDPYIGDVVHEIPLSLMFLMKIVDTVPQLLSFIFVLLDLATGVVLYKLARNVVGIKLKEQEREKHRYVAGTEDIWWDSSDVDIISRNVLLAYLFNPLSIVNCAGMTTTVFSNLFLALCLYFLSCKMLVLSVFFLALETMRNFYPFVLIAPIILFMKKSKTSAITVLLLFAAMCGLVIGCNFYFFKSLSFINGTFGVIFTYDNLQPNIGLFWYFFTEMFDHFRTMFLITFQINATVLYLIPLSLKVYKEPFLLSTVLIALMSVFRAYPSYGDVGFYLALIPLWRRSWKYMAHNFIVFCFFIITFMMMPVLWHLWIYAGSANANFYFGATLAFSTGQIFLATDILFAHIKRQFCLFHGEQVYIDGKEAKIVLE